MVIRRPTIDWSAICDELVKLIDEAFDATEGNGEPYIRFSRVFIVELRRALVARSDGAEPFVNSTNGAVMEEFLTRDEAVWALIDEVRALRQGLGVTHSRDPIEIITDKYWGISSKEHIARTREIIAKAKAKVEEKP